MLNIYKKSNLHDITTLRSQKRELQVLYEIIVIDFYNKKNVSDIKLVTTVFSIKYFQK